jgi:hypothetical protein
MERESVVAADADAVYRCPKCGATSALLLPPAGATTTRLVPATALRDSHVALKCLHCAHVLRVSRHVLESGGARSGSSDSLE